jgi:hypothetical protein
MGPFTGGEEWKQILVGGRRRHFVDAHQRLGQLCRPIEWISGLEKDGAIDERSHHGTLRKEPDSIYPEWLRSRDAMFDGEGECSKLRLGRAELTVLGEPEPLEDDQVTVFSPEDVHGPTQPTFDPVIVGDLPTKLGAEDLELISGGKGCVIDHGPGT